MDFFVRNELEPPGCNAFLRAANLSPAIFAPLTGTAAAAHRLARSKTLNWINAQVHAEEASLTFVDLLRVLNVVFP